jgi:NADH-quinone oxidoreductase subunit J
VYAGAIMVLFLYVIMMLNLNEEAEPHKPVILKFAASICAGLFMIVLVGAVRGSEQIMAQSGYTEVGSVKDLGRVLFSEFLLPFEISSVLLLVAMVGAVMLGKEEEKETETE